MIGTVLGPFVQLFYKKHENHLNSVVFSIAFASWQFWCTQPGMERGLGTIWGQFQEKFKYIQYNFYMCLTICFSCFRCSFITYLLFIICFDLLIFICLYMYSYIYIYIFYLSYISYIFPKQTRNKRIPNPPPPTHHHHPPPPTTNDKYVIKVEWLIKQIRGDFQRSA